MCYRHFEPREVERYSNLNRPKPLKSWSPFWHSPSTRPPPRDTLTPYIPPLKLNTPNQKLRHATSQLETLNEISETNVIIETKVDEVSFLKEELRKANEKIKKLEIEAAISIVKRTILFCEKSIERNDDLVWCD